MAKKTIFSVTSRGKIHNRTCPGGSIDGGASVAAETGTQLGCGGIERGEDKKRARKVRMGSQKGAHEQQNRCAN